MNLEVALVEVKIGHRAAPANEFIREEKLGETTLEIRFARNVLDGPYGALHINSYSRTLSDFMRQ